MSEAALLTDKPATEPYHVESDFVFSQGVKRRRPKRRQTTDLDHQNREQSRNSFIRDCIDMHNLLKAKVKDPKTEAKDKAACARACDTMLERIRILRGQPMPGVLRPEGSGKSRKSRGKGAEVVAKEAAKNEVKPVPSPAVQPTVLPKPEAQGDTGDSQGVSPTVVNQKQAI